MLPRPLVMTGLLGTAVAAPIAVTEGPKRFDLFGGAPAAEQPAGGQSLAPQFQPPVIASPEGPGSLVYQSPAPITGNVSVDELINLDVTKDWVYGRWARKSTGLADPELFGVRAPVVTGTQPTDLAGSISYYFNAQGRVDRLRFHGRTADTRWLVAIVQNRFGMQRETAPPGEQLYRSRSYGRVLGELRTRTEPVLWSTSPHESFLVDLEINRPGADRFVEQRPLTPDLPPAEKPAPAPVATPPSAQQTAGGADPPAAQPDAAQAEVQTVESDIKNARRPDFRWPN